MDQAATFGEDIKGYASKERRKTCEWYQGIWIRQRPLDGQGAVEGSDIVVTSPWPMSHREGRLAEERELLCHVGSTEEKKRFIFNTDKVSWTCARGSAPGTPLPPDSPLPDA